MRTASLLLLLLLSTRALAQPAPALQLQPLSGEILISVSDVASRLRPAVAADRAGRFVVAWREIEGQDGGIAGRRLSTTGRPASPGFVIAPRETGLHTSDPRIVARSDGGFLVAWGDAAFLRPGCARARSFSLDTAPAGDIFALGDCTTENGRAPEVALAGLPDGRFTAAWESGQAMPPMLPMSQALAGGFSVLVRQFASAGVPLSEALRASEPKEGGPGAGEQTAPAAAVHADGRSFVLWLDSLRAAIMGRRFDAGGQPIGPSFRVDAGSGFPVQAAVAVSLSGRSVVAWSAFTGQEMRIVAQLFDAGGRKHGEPVSVSLPSGAPRGPRDPDVAIDAAGNFVVVWDADQVDGAGTGVLGRLFDPAGVPQGPPFQINVTRPGSQGHPAVAFGRDDRFLVVWESQKNANARGSIVGRLYFFLRPVVPLHAPK